MQAVILSGIFLALILLAVWAGSAYRRDLQHAAVIIAAGRYAETPCGSIEYAVHGNGRPLLLIHGAGGGFDQGLLLGRLLVGESVRLITPSRFGYLGSPVPADDSLAAQANHYACLFDALGIEEPVPVCAVSAGGLSALQFAADHPQRVSALILISAITQQEGDTAEDKRSERLINRLVANDLFYWLLTKVAPKQMMAAFGVPMEAQDRLSRAEHELNREVLASMLPLSRRLAGIAVDQSRDFRPDFPYDAICAPTLVVHAADDTLVDPANGRLAASAIPGAELTLLTDGGHFLCGHHDQVRAAVIDFITP